MGENDLGMALPAMKPSGDEDVPDERQVEVPKNGEEGESTEVSEASEKPKSTELAEQLNRLLEQSDYGFAMGVLNREVCAQELIDIVGIDELISALDNIYKQGQEAELTMSSLLEKILEAKGQNTPEGRKSLIQQVRDRMIVNESDYKGNVGKLSPDARYAHMDFGYGSESALNGRRNSLDDAEQVLGYSPAQKVLQGAISRLLGRQGEDDWGMIEMMDHFAVDRLKSDISEHEGNIIETIAAIGERTDKEVADLLHSSITESGRLQAEIQSIREEYAKRFKENVLSVKKSSMDALKGLGDNQDSAALVESITQRVVEEVQSVKQTLIDERNARIQPLQQELDTVDGIIAGIYARFRSRLGE